MTTLKDLSDNTVAAYTYDWSGRRISKTYNSVTTTYVYDEDHIIAEYEGETLKRKYIYGPGIDFPIIMLAVDGQTETKYYYFRDALGSVVALLNNSIEAVIRNSVVSYPYKAVLISLWDAIGTCLKMLSRFLQPDPIGYADSMNLYQYCLNNPVNFVDPYGLKICWKQIFNDFMEWFKAWITTITNVPDVSDMNDLYHNCKSIRGNLRKWNKQGKEDFDGNDPYPTARDPKPKPRKPNLRSQ